MCASDAVSANSVPDQCRPLAVHGAVHGPGHVAVLHDTDADVLIYHYYYSDATPLTGKLGINLIGYDSAGWPYVY